MIAALLSLAEFLLKTQQPLLDLIMIISGACLIFLLLPRSGTKPELPAGWDLTGKLIGSEMKSSDIRSDPSITTMRRPMNSQIPPDQTKSLSPKIPGGDRNDKI